MEKGKEKEKKSLKHDDLKITKCGRRQWLHINIISVKCVL